MDKFIISLVRTRWFAFVARIVLTSIFWMAGLFGVFNFEGKVSEMRGVGLEPPELFAVAVTIVQLGGAALIVANRFAWLGAGALGIFLLLTIPIAHPFWTMPEPRSTFVFFVVLEHIALIGGLMVAAALGARDARTILPERS